MLTPVELAILAIGLGCDAFAVAIVAGTQGITPRRLFRLSWHTGLFQFLMPVAGYGLGAGLASIIGHITRFVGGAVLIVIAAHMLVEGIRYSKEATTRPTADLTRGWMLVGVSVATSIDALMVGLWLGITGGELLFQSAVIGLTAGLMTMTGMLLGRMLSRFIGRAAYFMGGAALFILAIRLFF
jgi:putative Mn2+ efflux pump MntP